MIKDQIEQQLNEQLNREFGSAYLYLAMSSYCEAQNLDGFAHWLLLQAEEEIGHGMKIFRYLSDRGARIVLKAVQQPNDKFGSLIELFQYALDNEKLLSSELEKLSETAAAAKDRTTQHFLNWFLEEQVEEVATCSTILEKLKLIKGEGSALLFLNEEMKRRAPEVENQAK